MPAEFELIFAVAPVWKLLPLMPLTVTVIPVPRVADDGDIPVTVGAPHFTNVALIAWFAVTLGNV